MFVISKPQRATDNTMEAILYNSNRQERLCAKTQDYVPYPCITAQPSQYCTMIYSTKEQIIQETWIQGRTPTWPALTRNKINLQRIRPSMVINHDGHLSPPPLESGTLVHMPIDCIPLSSRDEVFPAKVH